MVFNMAELIDSYMEYNIKIEEYRVVNNIIKDYLKKRLGKMVIGPYELELKYVDKSTYNNSVVDYLKKKKLTSFIDYKISVDKIKSAVKNNILDRTYVLSNIKKEKTYLNINIVNWEDDLNKKKDEMYAIYSNKDIIECIEKRLDLRIDIAKIKSDYFLNIGFAKNILLRDNYLDPYKFKYDKYDGSLKIEIGDVEYKDGFAEELIRKDIGVVEEIVNNKKLIKSKSKKLDSKYLDHMKIYKYDELLYIREMKGLSLVDL